MQSRSYTMIILGAPEKQFAIYVEPSVGRRIQSFLTSEKRVRPMTQDLLDRVLEGLEVTPLQVVISAVDDTVYFARLYLEQKIGDRRTILEIDARPSDCMLLVLKHRLPIFCHPDVLEKAIPVQT